MDIDRLFYERKKEIYAAADNWSGFVRKYGIDSDDHIIVLSKRQNLNEVVCSAIGQYIAMKGVKRLFLIGTLPDQYIHGIKSDVWNKVFFIDSEELIFLDRLYRLYCFTNRLIFCDTLDVCDKDAFALADARVSIYEILTIGILGINGNSKEIYDEYAIEKLNSLIERCERGKELYEYLTKKDKEHYIFLNRRASGNTYLAGLYLPETLRNKGIRNYTLVNISKANDKLSEIMSIHSINMDEDSMRDLWSFGRMMGSDIKFRELCPYDMRTSMTALRAYKGIDFGKMYRRVIYGIDDKDYSVVLPQNDSSHYFRELGLREGKTVLIAPNANTVSKISDEYWKNIADELISKGFDVCTNCDRNSEPIEGTIGIFIPYSEVVDFLDRAGYFIGLRSGLCDIVSSTSAYMTVIYATEFDLKYFGLVQMGLRKDNIEEIVREE